MALAEFLLTGYYRKQQHVLCLPPATGELPETGGVIISSPACPTPKNIEHAGHVYQKMVIRSYSINGPSSDEDATSQPSTASTPSRQPSRGDSIDAASALRSKIAIGSEDLYELLELGDNRWHATADDIKKSFRRISLTYHPDKISHHGEEARANSESHFKAVMKAYDILSDKKKRAAYDSIDDVDDSIPSDRDGTGSPERFYNKFGYCFALNARWSVTDRVPELGDDDTNIETVQKFYDFWYSFKSWRDFSFDLEYNTDQAECREEKRWMERQNSKRVKVKKAEENTRIRKLVDLAYKHDPRLHRVREAEKAKKNAKKMEKQKIVEERARAEQEQKDLEAAEAARIAAEEKEKRAEAKKQKEIAKKIMRKARQRLRGICTELNIVVSERGNFIVEKLCLDGTVESIGIVSDLLSELDLNASDASTRAFDVIERAVKNPKDPLQLQEVSNCSGADVDQDTGNGPSVPEASEPVHEKTEHNTNTESSPKANSVTSTCADSSPGSKKNSEPSWTADELSLLSKGVAKFPGGTRGRWEKLANYIGTKTADEVLQKVNESRKAKARTASTNVGAKQNDAKAFERFQEKKKGKPIVPREQAKTAANGSAAPASAPSLPSQPPNRLQFTPKEQSLFEGALRKFPASDGDARWKKVANVVGRASGDCQQRFNELIMYYQARKQAK